MNTSMNHCFSTRLNPLKPIARGVLLLLLSASLALKAKPGDTTVTLTPARHTSYQSGSEAQKEQLKTTASTLGKKMANAQSIYENLIKVLTSTIGAMLDTAKSFFQN